MQNESNDTGRDIPESDKSKLEAELASEHLTVFICKLDLETKKKLHRIMENENHFTFTETMRMLIDLEYDRIMEAEYADV